MCWVTGASALLSFLLYYNTLDAGFVYDDRRAILTNPDVVGRTPAKALFQNDFWGTPLTDNGSHGSYRPLCVATYRLNFELSGLTPWSYHFLNVLFHCTATVLVVITAKKLLPRSCAKIGTAVAGLSFAAHPIHTEAVAAIVGRADLAACNLFLLSFLVYNEHLRFRDICNQHQEDTPLKSEGKAPSQTLIASDQNFRLSCYSLIQQIFNNLKQILVKRMNGDLGFVKAKAKSVKACECSEGASDYSESMQWMALGASLLLASAATLCKEPAIMVIPVCIIYDLFRKPSKDTITKNQWQSICVMSGGGMILLYWRLQLAGTPPAFAAADNPTARDPSLITRTLTFAYLPVFNFYLLLYPFHLSFDWSMDAIPRITSIFDLRNVFTVSFYTLLSKIAWTAIRSEVMPPTESKEMKLYKPKGNSKAKNKSSFNNKQSHRGGANGTDRRPCNVPRRERSAVKKLCPCTRCRHPLSNDHTGNCRTINNNNYMSHHSCVCSASTMTKQLKTHTVHNSPRAVLVIFVAFMTLPFVPASNFLFYVGFVVAERVLYLPSVGFCLLLGLGAGLMTRGWRRDQWQSRVFMGSMLLFLAAMCGRTLRRNLDWYDEESLFKSALHINPPKAYGNLGSVLSAQGRISEAEFAFHRALVHRPNMADVHYNLGILLQNQRRYETAIKSFERAIYFRPSMVLAYVNLGASLAAAGRLAEAVTVLRAGTRVDGSRVRDRREHNSARVSALVQLAALYIQQSHLYNALAVYKEALQILPDSDVATVGWNRHSVLTMAGEIYEELRHWSLAEQDALAALNSAPQDATSHLAYAKLIARNLNRISEAEEYFKKALNLAPSDPAVRDEFGQFLNTHQRVSEAAEQFVAAAQLEPMDARRAATAARSLRDAQQCHAAEKWYARTVELSPQDAQSHSNFGAILHLNGKYTEAVTAYKRALDLLPGDEITLTNLKRVTNLMTNHRTKSRESS